MSAGRLFSGISLALLLATAGGAPDEPENETAGVQATPDRASIRVRIVGALEQIAPAVSQAVRQISIPSTGGPAAAALLIGLAALGAAGFWLRYSGQRPSA